MKNKASYMTGKSILMVKIAVFKFIPQEMTDRSHKVQNISLRGGITRQTNADWL